MDKVERPCLVRPLRLTPRLAMHDHLAPPRLLCSQGQTFLAVQPVNNVAADAPAFALQHHMHPAIAIADPCCHDLMHPLPDRSAWIPRRSEEHTSELQSLLCISYAVFCLKKTKNIYKKRESQR